MHAAARGQYQSTLVVGSNAQFFDHQRLKSARDEKNMIHNKWFDMAIPGSILL